MATLIIPAAGHATRMNSQVPKALTLIDGRSIIERVIERYIGFIEEVIVVIRPDHHKLFTNHFKDFELPIKLIFQKNSNGTADAVNIALASVQSEVAIVIWGDHIGASFMPDNLISEGIGLAEDNVASFPVVYKENPYVYFEFSDSLSLESFHETRKLAPVVAYGWSDCGVFFLNKKKMHKPLNEFLGLNEDTLDLNFLQILPWLALSGNKVLALKADDERLTLGVNSKDELKMVSDIFKSDG